MQPDANRILNNITVLLKNGLFTGNLCGAVPEALGFVEAMIKDAQPTVEASNGEA